MKVLRKTIIKKCQRMLGNHYKMLKKGEKIYILGTTKDVGNHGGGAKKGVEGC